MSSSVVFFLFVLMLLYTKDPLGAMKYFIDEHLQEGMLRKKELYWFSNRS